ncbi:MAG: hypothetical protein ACI8UO_005346 [Verrucomicrobiales bacterium]|jgi:hypothetical protein
MMKYVMKEPLVHFLLLGAGLFLAYSLVSGPEQRSESAIVVSVGKIEHLSSIFARTWQRSPTRGELEGLVAEFVHDEAAYREGVAAGLDRDDVIVRRRIRQKLEFIAEDLTGQAPATEDELAAYLASHPDEFREDPRFSFRQIYLNGERRGSVLAEDAQELLSRLNRDPGADSRELGDRLLLEYANAGVAQRDVAAQFGHDFAEAIGEIDPGRWHGPIESGFGVHLVIVDERVEGGLPELSKVRDSVRREWDNVRRETAKEQFYEEMLGRYEVLIQWPESNEKAEGK